MEGNRTLHTWELAALLTLCICLAAGLWAEGRQARLAAQLVRLHVLAVSDSAEEQAVKLRVRDAVLRYLAPKLRDAADAEAAATGLSSVGRALRGAAEAAAGGRPVAVTLGEERYPTREYAGFTLPAGRYRSLRVVLGEGQGRNWWCIVFPPVCLPAVQREALLQAMNPEDYALITREEGWQIRFRILELWGELTEKAAERDD